MKTDSFEQSVVRCLDHFIKDLKEANPDGHYPDDWIVNAAAHFHTVSKGDLAKQLLYFGMLEALRQIANNQIARAELLEKPMPTVIPQDDPAPAHHEHFGERRSLSDRNQSGSNAWRMERDGCEVRKRPCHSPFLLPRSQPLNGWRYCQHNPTNHPPTGKSAPRKPRPSRSASMTRKTIGLRLQATRSRSCKPNWSIQRRVRSIWSRHCSWFRTGLTTATWMSTPGMKSLWLWISRGRKAGYDQ